jgi:hypothetical protein
MSDAQPTVEARLVDAFAAARSTIVEHPDLFARVTRSIADMQARRRFRRRLAAGIGAFVLANVALALALSDRQQGSITMDWWVIEVITNIVLVAIAVALGPFIKRFGRSYAADVFRDNPSTGKAYLVLTDVAYYLIFTAFIFFTVTFVAPEEWLETPGNQYRHELARIGGILLIMGILHAANVVALPIIGNLLSHRMVASAEPHSQPGRATAASTPFVSTPPLGPGTWILRIEPAPDPQPDGDEPIT